MAKNKLHWTQVGPKGYLATFEGRPFELIESEKHKECYSAYYDGKCIHESYVFFELEEAKERCELHVEKLDVESMNESTQVGGDHYSSASGMDIRDFITQNNVPFNEGNVMKYVFRHRDKNGLEDLQKAKEYIDYIIKTEYEHNT